MAADRCNQEDDELSRWLRSAAKRSVATITASLMPGSLDAQLPAPLMTTSSPSGQAWASSRTVTSGAPRSRRPSTMTPGMPARAPAFRNRIPSSSHTCAGNSASRSAQTPSGMQAAIVGGPAWRRGPPTRAPTPTRTNLSRPGAHRRIRIVQEPVVGLNKVAIAFGGRGAGAERAHCAGNNGATPR